MSRNSLVFSGWFLSLTAGATLLPSPNRVTEPPSAMPPDIVSVTGTTNRGSFTCHAKEVVVSVQVDLEDLDRTKVDGLPAVKGGALAIPVRSLDCGGQQMNEDLFRTLGGSKNSTISFNLDRYAVLDPTVPPAVRMTGSLRLGGTQRPVVIYGTVSRGPGGDLRFRGEHELDVRDFGIKPPRRFLGIVRVHEDVTIHFDVAVRPLIDPMGLLGSTTR